MTKMELKESEHDSEPNFEPRLVVFLYLQTFRHVYFHTVDFIHTKVWQSTSQAFAISTQVGFVALCITIGVEIVIEKVFYGKNGA